MRLRLLQIPFMSGPLDKETMKERCAVATQAALCDLGDALRVADKQRTRKARTRTLLSYGAVVAVLAMVAALAMPLLLPAKTSAELAIVDQRRVQVCGRQHAKRAHKAAPLCYLSVVGCGCLVRACSFNGVNQHCHGSTGCTQHHSIDRPMK